MRKLIFIAFSFSLGILSLKGQSHSIESIETLTINYFGSKNKQSFLLEKFDTLGRLIYKNIENGKTEVYYFYNDLKSSHAYKSMKVNSSFVGLPDTLIFRNSHNEKGKLINEVVTTSSDSLLWIKNFEYNEMGDPISSSYHKTPDWILNFMPEYLKDSIAYDYVNNIKANFSLSTNHEVLSSTKGVLKPKKNNWQFDEWGNLLKNENVKNDYEYDENGNWTLWNSFYLKNKKEVPAYTKKRKIKYRK